LELAAVIAAVCIGEGGLITMPFMLGGVADRFMVTSGVSGLVASLQFGSMAIIAIILSPVVNRINRRAFALVALVLTLAAHLGAIVASEWPLFLASRAAAGVGEGALLTIGTAAAAGTPYPQRTFSLVTLGYVVMGCIVYLSLPSLFEHFGPIAVFYVLLVICLVGSPWLFVMPNIQTVERGSEKTGADFWRPSTLILFGIACLYMGVNTLWAFSERIAVDLGIGPHLIGIIFVVMAIVTNIGPIAASICQRRWGYRRAILGGVVFLSLACAALGNALFVAMYFIAIVSLTTGLLYLVPIYRALTAVLDTSGRVAGGSIVVQTLSTAVGPFLASLALLLGGGYPMIGFYSAALITLSGVLVWRLARKADGMSPIIPKTR
jgi:predicted MFS family arabinose efflux permease